MTAVRLAAVGYRCLPLLAAAFVSACSDIGGATVTLKGERFAVELAETDAARRQGLMYREALAPGHGMLFIYPAPETLRFWMLNTKMPLDILFFDADRRLLDVFPEAPPCSAEPCARYESHGPAVYALELPASSVRALALSPGEILSLQR
ncbi:MAG TPA: DUF192 domain-containing protein [Gammaproteobacteria bacterium]|nr:DUF192 domain-containing protein [Gammaproteobacteria bacterium]